MMDHILHPIGIEQTLLELRLRNQLAPRPRIEPEDWSFLDLLLLPRDYPGIPLGDNTIDLASGEVIEGDR